MKNKTVTKKAAVSYVLLYRRVKTSSFSTWAQNLTLSALRKEIKKLKERGYNVQAARNIPIEINTVVSIKD